MRFLLAGAAALLATGMAVPPSPAQTTTFTPPAPEPQAPAAGEKQPAGKVVLSRSIDENGQTTTQAGPAAPAHPGVSTAKEPSIEDAERQAITFTDFDMDVRLRAEEHHLAVRALITVRNDGKTALAHIPLQISSSLNWERIRLNAQDLAAPVATLNSDTDHTGQLHEAEVLLPQLLPPGQSLQLDISYSGAIPTNAQRLLAIGTPQDVAMHSDWDRITVPFTGLRGFGNVVWYPVSTVPVILGDGARLFDEVGEHKLRLAGARFHLRLTVESPHGRAPSVALINGHPAPLAVVDAGETAADVASIATADSGAATLGYEAPSLFVAIRTARPGPNLTVWALPENLAPVQSWTEAATTVTPFLQGWLGQRPRAQLTLLDLPDEQDAPFETGAMLATSIRVASPEQLNGILAHALTHAWMQSPRAWLSEGVAHFMGTLWIEKQQGREKALEALEAGRGALTLAEPESPGIAPGQPLAEAISPVYYRTKATYVLWMLRDIAGDPTLSAALRAYNPSADVSLGYGRDTTGGSFQKLVEQAGTRRDLSWFFADWVDADKGLPDLTIDSVFPTPEASGDWLVAVNINNAGYASAEVPVTVRSASTSVTQRVIVPAHSKAVQRILIQQKPTEVQVNDGTIPETQATVHITHLDSTPASSSSSSSSTQP